MLSRVSTAMTPLQNEHEILSMHSIRMAFVSIHLLADGRRNGFLKV